jgi:DNA-binding NarL/FixJ family response regulator
MSRARILIADDHVLVREGLRRVLAIQPNWEICAEAVDGLDAVEQARQQRPDIAILDYSMPNLNGLEATRRIRQTLPGTEVLLLTMHASEMLVHDVLAAGAHGFMLKSDAGQALVQAIEALLRQETYFTPSVSAMVLQGYLRPDGSTADTSAALTPRERQIVQLIADGQSSKVIATTLHLSIKTIESHRSNILRKLKLSSLSELVRFAVRNKIIEA